MTPLPYSGFLGFAIHAHYKIIPFRISDHHQIIAQLIEFIHNVNYKSDWWRIRDRIDRIRFEQVDFISLKKFLETLIQTDDQIVVPNGLSVAMDSEFTEIGYVINIDTKMFEIYVGHQHHPSEDSPFGTMEFTRGYYPCKMIAKLHLHEITIRDVETAIKDYTEGFPSEHSR